MWEGTIATRHKEIKFYENREKGANSRRDEMKSGLEKGIADKEKTKQTYLDRKVCMCVLLYLSRLENEVIFYLITKF